MRKKMQAKRKGNLKGRRERYLQGGKKNKGKKGRGI